MMAVITTSLQAQERFVFGLHTELADKNTHNEGFDYGFNLGARMDLQMNNRILYISARAYVFPELNDLSYLDFDGRFGFNWRQEQWDEHRVYAGGIIGLIKRGGQTHPKAGIELGYDYYFSDNMYFGFNADWQWKTDSKLWNNNSEGHHVNSFGFEIGWHWN